MQLAISKHFWSIYIYKYIYIYIYIHTYVYIYTRGRQMPLERSCGSAAFVWLYSLLSYILVSAANAARRRPGRLYVPCLEENARARLACSCRQDSKVFFWGAESCGPWIAPADGACRTTRPCCSTLPATAAHLLPLKFVSCHPASFGQPTAFETSYCHPPTAFEICILPPHHFRPGRFLATAAHLLQLKFLSCHPTSLDQGDFSPAAFELCLLPPHHFRPGRSLTSYCCSPTALEICLLPPHQFRPGILFTSYVSCLWSLPGFS